MRSVFIALLIVVTASARAAELPSKFRLADVVITLNDSPRWPVGEQVVITISGNSTATIDRTKLPCTECRAVREAATVPRATILRLLNDVLSTDFFTMQRSYEARPEFFLHENDEIELGSVITTDQDYHAITITIGSLSKKVEDVADASPDGFKKLAAAIRRSVGIK